jgi:ribulose-phosphate 3-epimerase
MRNIKLSASMMCADYASLRDEVQALDEAGIDIYHIDIMDGSFVDNFGMGYQDMVYIKTTTTNPVEVHLMVRKPHNYLEILLDQNIDVIYIHPEVDTDTATTIEKIQKRDCIAGIAINPGTSLASIKELLYVTNRVLLLCVNPGHSGRTYQSFMDKKIEELIDIRRCSGLPFEIYLDGAVTKERIQTWTPRGVNGYVLGTATLFREPNNYRKTIEELKMIKG